jgi:hypothetical protein
MDERTRTELDGLRAELARVRTQVAALESGERTTAPPSAPEGRRAFLRRAAIAGAGAIGAVAAGTVVADPVAADNNQPLVLGSSSNTASLPTGLAVTGSANAYGIGVTDNGLTSLPAGVGGALFGHTKGQFPAGVYGYATGFCYAMSANSVDHVGLFAFGHRTGVEARSPDCAVLGAGGTVGGAFSGDSAVEGLGVRSGGMFQGNERGVFGGASAAGGVGGVFSTAGGHGLEATGTTAGGTFDANAGHGVEATGTTAGGTFTASAGPGVIGSGTTFGGSFSSPSGVALSVGGGRGAIAFSSSALATARNTGEVMRVTANGIDQLVYCSQGGNPGSLKVLASANTAGVLHLLTPARVYDSRTGQAPLNVTKGVLVTGAERDIDCNLLGGLPAATPKASAVLVTITVLQTSTNGFLQAYSAVATAPTSSVHNWDHAGTVAATTTVVRCDSAGAITIRCGGPSGAQCGFLVDLLGYYA